MVAALRRRPLSPTTRGNLEDTEAKEGTSILPASSRPTRRRTRVRDRRGSGERSWCGGVADPGGGKIRRSIWGPAMQLMWVARISAQFQRRQSTREIRSGTCVRGERDAESAEVQPASPMWPLDPPTESCRFNRPTPFRLCTTIRFPIVSTLCNLIPVCLFCPWLIEALALFRLIFGASFFVLGSVALVFFYRSRWVLDIRTR